MIQGTGTVDGNLTLGYPDGSGAPNISPGSSRRIGTLTITGWMQILADCAVTTIDVDASGAYDKIMVKGSATLGGELDATNISPDYKPPADTRLPFLTA